MILFVLFSAPIIEEVLYHEKKVREKNKKGEC